MSKKIRAKVARLNHNGRMKVILFCHNHANVTYERNPGEKVNVINGPTILVAFERLPLLRRGQGKARTGGSKGKAARGCGFKKSRASSWPRSARRLGGQ